MNRKEMYLDYVNNFLTVEKFAEHYGITEEKANEIIEEGSRNEPDSYTGPPDADGLHCDF